MIAKNATNAHVSSLYCSTRLYFCFSDIITAPERRIAYRPLLWWSGCPNNVAIICHLPHGVLCRPPSGYSLSSSLLVCSASRALGLCISLLGLFLCFCYYFIRLRVKEPLLYRHSTYARWRWDRSTLASTIPWSPRIRYCASITAVAHKVNNYQGADTVLGERSVRVFFSA